MRLEEYGFRDYYHSYMILEADSLTEQLKDVLPIRDEDCFVLCSSYVAENRRLTFNVLAVGDAADHCRRGLRRKAMLGLYEYWQVQGCEVRFVEPDLTMARKNAPWQKQQEAWADAELWFTRMDPRLDAVRDPVYPDTVMTGVLTTAGIREFPMNLVSFNGPFAEGRLAEEPEEVQGLHKGELFRALPYHAGKETRLLTVFAGSMLSQEDEEALKELIRTGEEAGFGFSIPTLKN